MNDNVNELDRAFGPEAEGKESKPGDNANAMVRAQAKGEQAYHYLIESLEKSALMEFLMRTVFDSREEMLLFIDYVSWCDDFGLSKETARRFVASLPAIRGVGRKQLVQVLSMDWLQDRRKSPEDKDKPRKLPD